MTHVRTRWFVMAVCATVALAGTARVLSAHDLRIVTNALPAASDGEVAPGRTGAASDSSDVAGVVTRFHAALAAGDSAGALALLAPDVSILESGGAETRADYRSHHLGADIEFARAVPSTRGPVRVTVHGDVAWVSSTSTTQGDFRGRAVNSAGAELMVLARAPGGPWLIRAIHWSSRTRRAGS